MLKPDNLPPEVIEEITELKFRNYQLAQEIAQLKRMIFGSKSERFIASNNPAQLSLGINLEENSITPVIQKTVVIIKIIFFIIYFLSVIIFHFI